MVILILKGTFVPLGRAQCQTVFSLAFNSSVDKIMLARKSRNS